MTTGERIQAARKRAGLTQEQLAQKINSATITIRQYESGKREPRIDQLRKISAALEVSLMYLLGAGPQGTNTLDEATENYKGFNMRLAKKDGYKFDLQLFAGEPADEMKRLLAAYDLLNEEGQRVAVERVEELTEIPKYQKKEPDGN